MTLILIEKQLLFMRFFKFCLKLLLIYIEKQYNQYKIVIQLLRYFYLPFVAITIHL